MRGGGYLHGGDPWEALVQPVNGAAASSVSDDRRRVWSPTVVVGAVGGAGATTVSCGIALAGAAGGTRVALVELDLDRGGLAARWGVPPDRTIGDLAAVVEELRHDHVELVALPHPSGVSLLLAPGRPGTEDEWRDGRVRQLLDRAASLGGLVVDAGALRGSPARQACGAAGRVVVVSPPTMAGAHQARAAVGALREQRPDLEPLVVANRGVGRDHVSARAFARAVGRPLHCELPRGDGDADACLAGRWITRRRSRLRAQLLLLAADVGAQ